MSSRASISRRLKPTTNCHIHSWAMLAPVCCVKDFIRISLVSKNRRRGWHRQRVGTKYSTLPSCRHARMTWVLRSIRLTRVLLHVNASTKNTVLYKLRTGFDKKQCDAVAVHTNTPSDLGYALWYNCNAVLKLLYRNGIDHPTASSLRQQQTATVQGDMTNVEFHTHVSSVTH